MNLHLSFVAEAEAFKATLIAAAAFTPDEIAAMLGSFVLAIYTQRLEQTVSPDQQEYMTKATMVHERILEEMRGDP